MRGMEIDWERAARWSAQAMEMLLGLTWEPGTFWNINLPHLTPDEPEPGVVFCPLDPSPLPLSFREEGDVFHYDGEYRNRARKLGMDVDVCFGGQIAVSKITLL
jgi:5'-nucleotidase